MSFIKLRPGLLAPKHHKAIGGALWVYLLMLSKADWGTGVIERWTDAEAAQDLLTESQDLRVSAAGIRKSRRKLKAAGYIQCRQVLHGLEITINNWRDPREKEVEQSVTKVPLSSKSRRHKSTTHEDTEVPPYPSIKSTALHSIQIHESEMEEFFSPEFLALSRKVTGINFDLADKFTVNGLRRVEKLKPEFNHENAITFGEWWLRDWRSGNRSNGMKSRPTLKQLWENWAQAFDPLPDEEELRQREISRQYQKYRD